VIFLAARRRDRSVAFDSYVSWWRIVGMKTRTWKSIVVLLSLFPLTTARAGTLDKLKQFAGGAKASKTIAYFQLKGPMAETPTEMPPLFGSEPPISLKSLLERFKQARKDENVAAVVVDLEGAQLGFGQLKEIHDAMRQFAAVDKSVFVHADSLFTGTYAASTGASHVSIVPTGEVWLMGLYGETPYVRGGLDKLGIAPDFETCGDFKTAAEPIMRSGPSDASKAMTKWLLDSLYESLVDMIAVGRGITPQKVRSLIDNGPYTAEEALAAGLIDSVQHRQDFVAGLKSRFGEDVKFDRDYGDATQSELPEDLFALVAFLMEIINSSEKVYTNPSVAVVYVEGPIQTGAAEFSPFGGSEGAYSTTIRRALDKAAEEESVKAVVLRVDSPGGSALASEIILDAAKRVAAKKPLIVSMGNVAGSGGYYVSLAAESIFADATTITASIGVVGGKLVTTDAWNKLGIHWHEQQRGDMAALLSSAKPFSEKERARIRHYMESVYATFKGHVSKSRGERLTKPLEEMAGGRVYTGAQALQLGLVDKLGGFEEAVKYAASRAGLGDYELRVIPDPPTIFDLFKPHDHDEEVRLASSSVRLNLAGAPLMQSTLEAMAALDPMRVRAVLRLLKLVELVHHEGVVMMMPAEWVIR